MSYLKNYIPLLIVLSWTLFVLGLLFQGFWSGAIMSSAVWVAVFAIVVENIDCEQ